MQFYCGKSKYSYSSELQSSEMTSSTGLTTTIWSCLITKSSQITGAQNLDISTSATKSNKVLSNVACFISMKTPSCHQFRFLQFGLSSQQASRQFERCCSDMTLLRCMDTAVALLTLIHSKINYSVKYLYRYDCH